MKHLQIIPAFSTRFHIFKFANNLGFQVFLIDLKSHTWKEH